mmetsp:Transcript_14070/g.24158  ORF Transcript_14070/g.24158 Transcript_14070/m.24158 type:complete len:208 (-) Transcript_14070:96-719(-)
MIGIGTNTHHNTAAVDGRSKCPKMSVAALNDAGQELSVARRSGQVVAAHRRRRVQQHKAGAQTHGHGGANEQSGEQERYDGVGQRCVAPRHQPTVEDDADRADGVNDQVAPLVACLFERLCCLATRAHVVVEEERAEQLGQQTDDCRRHEVRAGNVRIGVQHVLDRLGNKEQRHKHCRCTAAERQQHLEPAQAVGVARRRRRRLGHG